MREAIAQYLGKTDPGSVKGASTDGRGQNWLVAGLSCVTNSLAVETASFCGSVTKGILSNHRHCYEYRHTDVVHEVSYMLFQALWEREPNLDKEVYELDSIVNKLLRRIVLDYNILDLWLRILTY